jgi:hypothetical protein
MMNATQLQQLKQNVMQQHPPKNKQTSNRKSFPPQPNLSQQPGYAPENIDKASLFSSTANHPNHAPNHGANHGAKHKQLQNVRTPFVQVATETQQVNHPPAQQYTFDPIVPSDHKHSLRTSDSVIPSSATSELKNNEKTNPGMHLDIKSKRLPQHML